jgi:signal transduction histidine kinase
MRKRSFWSIFVAFVVFVALAGLGSWRVLRTLRDVEASLPVATLSEHRGLSSMIQGLSELMTRLDEVRIDPSEQRWRDFTLALDFAYALTNAFLGDTSEAEGRARDTARREVLEILPVLDNLAAAAPYVDQTVALAQHARLRDTITLLREEYLLANQSAFLALQDQQEQIDRLRTSTLIVTLLVAVSVVLILAMTVWEYRTIRLLHRAQRESQANAEALRIARDEAEAANHAKSDFLANMSHELRTPMNAVIGFSEVLADERFGPLNEQQMRGVGHILSSGRHLCALINDTLDLSRVEAGRMELDPTDVRLPQLIEDSLDFVREKASRHGLSLATDIEGHARGLVFSADERRLKQVLLNLLWNAIKFTPDGGRVEVTARAIGGELHVSVSDDGIGVPEEDQERVFEEFEQLDSSYAKRQPGTGLGLALSRRIVELHGGRIWVESEGEGKGSTFSFTIPLQQTEQPA